MTNYNQLFKEQRDCIENLLMTNHSFTEIGKAIKKDRTTISKEIKRNRYIKSYFYSSFDQKGIAQAIDKCSFLQHVPYVCNKCKDKNKCSKHKLYYNSKIADEHYRETLVNARTGIDTNPEVIDEIEHSLIPLIKDKKQSINQIYANHSDVLFFSKVTFYKYVNNGVFSIGNLDLPKKVKYKSRKSDKDNNYKRKIAIQKGRTYDDYLKFISKHANLNLCQMDTVEGPQKSLKCLLTLIIVDTNFMFIRLLDKKNIVSVNCEIDKLKEKLGNKLFSKIFRIILTDNGVEFYDPLHIEMDYDSKLKTSNVFYCKPYSAWQKGCIEKNHEFIRKIFPKGTDFDSFSPITIKKLEDTINNIPRNSLTNKSPFELTIKKYPTLISSLNCSYIKPDDISLNPDDF